MVDPKTILIVQIGKIGDMILTTPLFREIKKLFPGSILSVLASNINKDIAESDQFVDKVYVYKKNIQNNFKLLFSPIKYQDLWIDTKDNYSKTSEILLKLFKPKLSLGYNFDKNIFDLDLKKYQNGFHATEINLSPVKYLADKNFKLNSKPEILIPEAVKRKIDHQISVDDEYKNIVVNVSAGSENRYMKNEVWIEIINRINEKGNYKFYITGLGKDKEIVRDILSKISNKNSVFIKTQNILETAEVIRKSDLTITPDTSIVHICSAFNIPVIAIYPDVKWNLDKFYPLSEKREVIISGNKENIVDIGPEKIIDSFERISRTF